MVPNRAFPIDGCPHQIALVLIESACPIGRNIHFLRVIHLLACRILHISRMVEKRLIHSLIAIESIKITERITKICEVNRQTMVRNHVFRIVVKAKNARMLGRISRLKI